MQELYARLRPAVNFKRKDIPECVACQGTELTHQKLLEMGIVAPNKKVLEYVLTSVAASIKSSFRS